MERQKKRRQMTRHQLAVILAGIVLLCMIVCTQLKNAQVKLLGVSDMVLAEEQLYVIDNYGEDYQILRTSLDGQITGWIRCPKLKNMCWRMYEDISVDEDGTVYVYEMSRALDKNETRSTVYRCDFEQSRLEEVWMLPARKMIRVSVQEGKVYYQDSPAPGQTDFFCMDLEGNAELLAEYPVEYSQIVHAWYEKGKGVWYSVRNGRFFCNGIETGLDGARVRNLALVKPGPDGLVYVDLRDGWIKRLGWEGRTANYLIQEQQLQMIEEGKTLEDLFLFHVAEDGSFTAGIDHASDVRAAALFDGTGRQLLQLEALTLHPGLWLWDTVKICLLVLVLLLLCYLALEWFWKRSGGLVPVVGKLLSVLIPVVLLSCVGIHRHLETALRSQMVDMHYEMLYSAADQTLALIEQPELEMQNLGDMAGILRGLLTGSGLKKELWYLQDEAADPVVASIYQWFYHKDQEEFRYILVDGRHYNQTLVRFDRDRLEMEKIEDVFESGRIIKTQYNDFTGDFLALYVPVKNCGGQVTGVMECGLNMRVIFYEAGRQMRLVRRMLSVLVFVLTGILVVVLVVSLRPLARVQGAMERTSGGELGCTVTVRGHDEVARIAAAFNHMSLRLQKQVRFIQECADCYSAFVPEQALRLMGRSDITQVQLGDQKQIQTAVLEISSQQFQKKARVMSGEQLYRSINKVLGEVLPVVEEYGGVVDEIREDGASAYFQQGADHALRGAIRLGQRMAWLRSENQELPMYRMALHYGNVRVGIVGSRQRMDVATVSEVMTLCRFVEEMAERYHGKILVTGSFAGQVEAFETRYHVRLLGYLHLKAAESMEPVYEVFDAEGADLFAQKQRTQTSFANALEAYLAEDYTRARREFARVLRENPSDRAAREYIYRCDAWYRAQESGSSVKPSPYLEEY